MLKRNQRELIDQLKSRENYRFTEFELFHEGNYSASDADWNYKDVPHLACVHKLVEGHLAYVSNDFVSAILIQQVLGVKFPAVIFNYQSGHHRQTYFITMLIYVLIVETTYEELGENRTRVRTRYGIGCRSWLAALLFPLARYAIRKNYEDLMAGDIPMRERRGWLRNKGYTFKGDKKPYSFFETSLIMESNVLPPENEGSKVATYSVSLANLSENATLPLGDPDQFGLVITRNGTKINFFERLCPHEGADLTANCKTDSTTCPWHGRKFKPLYSLDVSVRENQNASISTPRLNLKFQGQTIDIEVKPLTQS